MTKLLIKLFVKDYENTKDERVRGRYGVLSGAVGIAVNIILSAFKIVFGKIVNSISIVSDGVNNLFDAVSSIITLVGFKLSGKKPDKNHPFGHGRIEYLSAIVLAFLIIVTGVELLKGSIAKFGEPSAVTFSIPAAVVLVASIFMKIWLAMFNKNVGQRIDSVSVDAVVKDSLGDILATTCTLIALIASKFISLPIDAIMGCFVSLVILYAGVGVIKDTLGPLLGEPPEKEVVDELEKLVMAHDGIVGVHDLVLHGYGHSKVMGSLHAEVPASTDIMESHDLIDRIEQEIKTEMGIEISIHMDPILTDDEKTNELKAVALKCVKEIDEGITIHDFRIVVGPTHTNMIFDAVIPFELKMTDEEFKSELEKKIKAVNSTYFIVLTIDRPYA